MESEAGFSLTELLAGLFIAALLLVGVVELVRRYAVTTSHVQHAAQDVRASRIAQNLLLQIERVDPGTLAVSENHIGGQIGGVTFVVRVSEQNGHARLEWSSGRGERAIDVPTGSHFVVLRGGAIALTSGDAAPVAVVQARRTAPYDCAFDAIARACRQ